MDHLKLTSQIVLKNMTKHMNDEINILFTLLGHSWQGGLIPREQVLHNQDPAGISRIP